MWYLVHIPKTGGISFGQHLEKQYRPNFYYTKSHSATCSIDNSITVIRDPVERFLSAFNFWKHGSSYCALSSSKTENLKEYIEYVKNEDPRLQCKHSKMMHTWPQVHWVPRDTWSKTVVIRYRKNLSEVLEPLLEYIEIPWDGSQCQNLNVTSKRDDVTLDSDDLEWLRDHYREDFELWDAVNTRPEIFKKVL